MIANLPKRQEKYSSNSQGNAELEASKISSFSSEFYSYPNYITNRGKRSALNIQEKFEHASFEN